jgi:hypothetical protein
VTSVKEQDIGTGMVGVQEGGKNNLNANVQVHGTTNETDFTEEEEEYANECLAQVPDVYCMSLASVRQSNC